jgi:hypothetical protein
MKKRIALLLALSFIFACMIYPAYACTIFNAAGNQMLLVGNNEEHEDPNGEVRFEPSSEGKYGTITFAFGPFTQGGMNEQGLFFDSYAPNNFRASPWIPGQLLLTGELPDRQPTLEEIMELYTKYDTTSKKMLDSCATVEEAVLFYQKYYEGIFGYAYTMVVDKTGASATFTWDWDQNKMSIERKTGSFQVMGIGRDYVFSRLNVVSYEVSVDNFRELLKNTSRDDTAYSNIYDLKNGEVYVYNQHDFDFVMQFNLEEELAKGSHSFYLKDLFKKP